MEMSLVRLGKNIWKCCFISNSNVGEKKGRQDKSITSVKGRHFVTKYLIHVIQRWGRRSDVILLNATGMSYSMEKKERKTLV